MATARRGKRADEILDAAIQVFYERGYADATVQDVADAVGILKGSLYHYIKTKEDLLFQLFELVHEQVELIKDAAESAEGLDPVQRLEMYVDRQVEYNLANIQRISVYYHDLGLLGPERLAYVRAENRAHNLFVTKLIEEAQSQGLADDSCDPRMLANCVFSTIIWTYRWYRDGGRAAGQASAAELTSFFALRGIGARG
jgi:AcrR family transcriptional regulator